MVKKKESVTDHSSGDLASSLRKPLIGLSKRRKGETEVEFKRRLEKELQQNKDFYNDPSRISEGYGSFRKHPVRYD